MKAMKTLGLVLFSLIAAAPMAFAAVGEAAATNKFDVMQYAALAAGFGLGIAALGGALGQGRAAATALEGIARNPGAAGKIQTPMILGLALIESLVIYSLVISILLWLKIQLG